MTTEFDGPKALLDGIGTELGPTDWITITQDQINTFAEATLDNQWIHVDTERAKAGPFGAPIAHGYLTMSLAAYFLGQLVRVAGISMGINYGADKVRFPSPVPVGSKLRGAGELDRGQGGSGRRAGDDPHHDRARGRRQAGRDRRSAHPVPRMSLCTTPSRSTARSRSSPAPDAASARDRAGARRGRRRRRARGAHQGAARRGRRRRARLRPARARDPERRQRQRSTRRPRRADDGRVRPHRHRRQQRGRHDAPPVPGHERRATSSGRSTSTSRPRSC